MYSRRDENEIELYFKLEVVKFYHEKLSDSRWVVSEDQMQEEPKGIEVCDTHTKGD